MQRRSFLARSLGTSLALGAGGFGRHAWALSPEGGAFDAAIAGQPALAPFKGIDPDHAELHCDALQLAGRWPAGLAGRFYRNGPAVFERDGQRYHHWFAGDGMVQQLRIGGGTAPKVAHLGRLVRTPKLVAEQQAGRFLYTAYGTRIDSEAPTQGPDTFNVANTNALEHAGRVLAMWEGGSAFALSPDDLATQGAVTWAPGLEQMPFSAHPKLDPAGNLWNFGTAGANLVVWQIDARGRLVRAQTGASPYPGGMAHDAAITARHIVLPLPPIKLRFGEDAASGQAFSYEPNEPLRILVMKKDDIAERRVFELPMRMVFHVGNAHEEADGSIVLSFVGSPSADFVQHGASDLLAGHMPAAAGAPSTLLARLDMRTGRASVEAFDDCVEFPRVHPALNGLPMRYLLSAASWRPAHHATAGLFHGVQLRDLETGRVARHDYGADTVAEEHIVVPKPGRRAELDAWLLGTSYDTRRRVTRVNLFEARHLADGPIATATLPYGLPYGFHGNFTAA